MITSALIDGVYYPIFCAKTAELILDQEEIEVTSVNSGSDREYLPGMNSATLACTGITTIDNSGGRISIVFLMQQSIRRTIQTLQIKMTDDDGNILNINCQGFIRNNSLTREIGSYSQSSTTFRITGGITFDQVIPAPVEPVCEVQDPLYLDTVEGETTVTVTEIVPVGDEVNTVLQVWREGTQLGPEITGTPASGTRQFSVDYDTGIIAIDPDNPFNAGETMYVLFKRTV